MKNIIIEELVTREDGSIGLGNSYEVTEGEAKKLVNAGTHKYLDKPINLKKDIEESGMVREEKFHEGI